MSVNLESFEHVPIHVLITFLETCLQWLDVVSRRCAVSHKLWFLLFYYYKYTITLKFNNNLLMYMHYYMYSVHMKLLLSLPYYLEGASPDLCFFILSTQCHIRQCPKCWNVFQQCAGWILWHCVKPGWLSTTACREADSIRNGNAESERSTEQKRAQHSSESPTLHWKYSTATSL